MFQVRIFLMKEAEKIDFNFRYRPLADTYDLNSPAKFVEFAKRVRKTYEQNYDELESFSINLELKIESTKAEN